MSLIRKPQQLEVPQKIKALIYGQAGMGKTTLALSAPKPLLLDFDCGIHRVNYGHQSDTVPIHDWNEALNVIREDLSDYETIVVDTIGKMMDYIIEDTDKKGITGWKRWDKINEGFSTFVHSLRGQNKNIIFVAHRDTRKEGEETVFVPALREKNYTAIVTELDLLGYVEVKNTRRTITFNPTSRNDGKNTCNLPELINIPTVVDQQGNALANTFFQAQIISPYVNNLKKRMDDIKAYDSVISELKENIMLVTDELAANDFISRINTFNHIGNSKEVAKTLLSSKARELGLIFNKEEKRYEKAAS
ncbi:MAG: ATP-binding protein [Dysgonamonadaceae bacterium]|jgi:phage nucleotide-binding protein|nr:ATP-binding protein [Dysgonamonadaceae bacterium]